MIFFTYVVYRHIVIFFTYNMYMMYIQVGMIQYMILHIIEGKGKCSL